MKIRLRYDASTDSGAQQISRLTGLNRRMDFAKFGISGTVCSLETLLMADARRLYGMEGISEGGSLPTGDALIQMAMGRIAVAEDVLEPLEAEIATAQGGVTQIFDRLFDPEDDLGKILIRWSNKFCASSSDSEQVREAMARVVARFTKLNWATACASTFEKIAVEFGCIEIIDPFFTSIGGNPIFVLQPDGWEQMEVARSGFLEQQGISGPITVDMLSEFLPDLCFVPPELRYGYRPDLISLHPEITGPGIYFHMGLMRRFFPQLDVQKLGILFHEIMEWELNEIALRDQTFSACFGHEHPMILVAELLFAAVLGQREFDLHAQLLRKQLEVGQRKIAGLAEEGERKRVSQTVTSLEQFLNEINQRIA